MDSEITTTVGRELYSFDGRVLEICHGRPEAPGVRHIGRYSAAEWGDLPGLARLPDVVQAAVDSAAER
ncbi:hypothetical protein ACFRCI_31155 [Streptomyces sp. NPDC056638]|uniref:hypothetical protein n=1 Tax=Streptomyces sp. NPDC056638 TaxID=3345887 RepID=UPI0036AE5389